MAADAKKRHILAVDDEPRIAAMVRRYLSAEGFEVSVAADGEAMFRTLEAKPVDLVLLDLVMPGRDGLVLMRQLRERSRVPVIMLTGKGDMVDRVVGLEVGADDYIAKPFDLRELLARIRSVLRRAGEAAPAGAAGDAVPLRFGGWELDPLARRLTSPQGEDVALTAAEYALLRLFVGAPGRVLSRDHILDRVGNRHHDPFDRSVDVLVGRLRRKLRDAPVDSRLIKAVRGEGYLFAAPVERAGGT